MKFMKLGSKPDTFESDDKFHKYAVSDLDSDVTINVGEFTFYLHKFPLLSKSNRMQRLVSQASEENINDITISDIPGGHKAFEICAKFCYGMTVTLNACNITSVRCAAEYLEMTEDADRGNLIYKIEVFLNSGIFRSWKDSIIMLQTTKSLLPWSEDLKLVARCIDSVSTKILANPETITWSYTHNRKLSGQDKIVEYHRENVVPKDWWVEDVCELEIDMFKNVMSAVKSSGRMNSGVISEALRYYVARWLPESIESVSEASSNKHLVETVVSLLPRVNRAMSYSTCSFLLKLLKVSFLVGADETVIEDLVENVSLKLHEASVKDLLIHEVELVHRIVDRFVGDEKGVSEDDRYKEFVLGNGVLLSVGRLIDAYLASNRDLTLSSFVELSEMIPEAARPINDGLYKAIDTFLKEHPELTKSEKKRLCGLMDVRKLTSEASAHAAQNERLPLRVVVQVLYFEQLRANHSPVGSVAASSHSPIPPVKKAEESIVVVEEETKKVGLSKKSRGSKSTRSGGGAGGPQLMPSRSRRIFEKIWPGKGESNKSSEVSSGSSQSPPGKSSSSSSRDRRHSIS
ncbi:BTB/POZ domain-containing protein NPY1 [Raphanus sativus]|uniref:BTB/POZ domain-containing protein NPY1 n=1 Tax=Raphanus sativus TaxID=3726 RepID=A0A6J0MI00_RAPSA|nr:BTB/POZ domain-containing protein NPY1 [Raphanus sativus]KAJ4913668.1 BTB/POZ domain-containing protein NPY1 [Raphanus sativus]